jgi:hypothetical protein
MTKSRFHRLYFGLGSALALSACGQASNSGESTDTTSVARAEKTGHLSVKQTDVSRAPASHVPARTASARRDCQLVVDGKVQVEGPCLVAPLDDKGYTLNSWSEGKPARSHFAVVTEGADGSAAATWNADPDDDRAGDPLGTVTLADGCWVNKRVRICANQPKP